MPPACTAEINSGYVQSTGDSYVDYLMFWRAWLGIETVSQLRSRYDFELNFQNNTWDEGLGWNDVENDNKPFKRALNAFFLIENASSSPNPPGDYSGGIINYAWEYIKAVTPEFEGSCDTDSNAMTQSCSFEWWWCDRRIELQMPLWHLSPGERAGTIVHESRHAGGHAHNGGSGCSAGKACDNRYSDGKAHTREVQWLAQFYRNGNNNNVQQMRDRMLTEANRTLREQFTVCPRVQLNASGYFYSVSESVCQ